MADALGCDVEDIKPTCSLSRLDAESIDFLDMVFRLERAFKIKIPRGKIVENARGTLAEGEFEQKGIVTDVGHGAAQGVPVGSAGRAVQVADEGRGHSAAVHAGDLLQARRAGAARRSMAHLAAAGESLMAIDRSLPPPSRSSTASPSSRRPARRGTFAIPADIAAFPPCLMAEAVGQLAAWVAMSHIEFPRPPGRGARQRDAVPRAARAGGQMLDLHVDLHDSTTMRSPTKAMPTSTASALIELVDCLGPMLPLAEFDDPARWPRVSRCSPPRRAACALPRRAQRLDAIERAPGKSPSAMLHVPASRAVLQRPLSPPPRLSRRRSCSTRRSSSRSQWRARRARRTAAHDEREGRSFTHAEDALLHRAGRELGEHRTINLSALRTASGRNGARGHRGAREVRWQARVAAREGASRPSGPPGDDQ